MNLASSYESNNEENKIGIVFKRLQAPSTMQISSGSQTLYQIIGTQFFNQIQIETSVSVCHNKVITWLIHQFVLNCI